MHTARYDREMADRRFMVGERVLASRDQSGENHEEATVSDFYELLIEEDKIPQVVVDFDDGQRVWMTATEPNVLPIEEDDVSDEFDDEEPDEELDGDEDGDEEGEEDEPVDGWDTTDDE
jgi:hypothetical protein